MYVKPAFPQTAVEPETSGAARRTFGHRSEENSSASSFPQPWHLQSRRGGRCPAVSMKAVYSAFAAWNPAGFSVWVVSHIQWRPLGWSEFLKIMAGQPIAAF